MKVITHFSSIILVSLVLLCSCKKEVSDPVIQEVLVNQKCCGQLDNQYIDESGFEHYVFTDTIVSTNSEYVIKLYDSLSASASYPVMIFKFREKPTTDKYYPVEQIDDNWDVPQVEIYFDRFSMAFQAVYWGDTVDRMVYVHEFPDNFLISYCDVQFAEMQAQSFFIPVSHRLIVSK